MHDIGHDVRIVIRTLIRARGFTLPAVIILGISIGMSTAMTTVTRAVLLERLPVVDQDRLVVLSPVSPTGSEVPTMGDELDGLRRASMTMRAVGGVYHAGTYTFPLLDGERSVLPNRSVVTGNFFEVLGARPVVGRLLRGDDDSNGAFGRKSTNSAPIPLVLSYHAWQRWFGGSRAVVGQRLADPYGALGYTIVGVAPPGLDYPVGTEYWIPMGQNAGADVVARLSSRATPASARAELFAFIRRNRSGPVGEIQSIRTTSFAEAISGDIEPAFIVLGIASATLLVIACINVAGLFLLRSSARRKELAVRRAIGASFGVLLRNLLAESVAIAVAGGAFGLVCADALLHFLLYLAPSRIPRLDVIALAGTPIATACALTGVAVLLFGIAPAFLAASSDVAPTMRFDARAGSGRATMRMRRVLVGVQVALAVVMLSTAALLARSLEKLQALSLGYRQYHLSFVAIGFPIQRYFASPDKIFPLGDRILAQLRSDPGVASATPVLVPPLVGADVWRLPFELEGAAYDASFHATIPIEVGDSSLFDALGIRVLTGRTFNGSETRGGEAVVVVSASVAHRYWPGEDAIGKRIRLPAGYLGESVWRTVIGVVDDLHYRTLRDASPTVFLPWRQALWQGWVAVRTREPLADVLPAMRTDIAAIEPGVSLSQAESMDELLAAPLAEPRLSTFLMSAFGIVATLLCIAGLYAVMSAAVRQRTREMAIRLALGATERTLRRDVMREASVVVAVGVGTGIGVTLTASRVLSGVLFQVTATDPIALTAGCALTCAACFAAAYVPARRAARTDPASVLRAE